MAATRSSRRVRLTRAMVSKAAIRRMTVMRAAMASGAWCPAGMASSMLWRVSQVAALALWRR